MREAGAPPPRRPHGARAINGRPERRVTQALGPGRAARETRSLNRPLRLLVGGCIVAALVGIAATLTVQGGVPDPIAIVAIALGIALGEALTIDLPYRRGGTARFTLSDAVVAGGLLLVGPAELAIGAAAGMLIRQLWERVPSTKVAFNTAQYSAAAAAAALVVAALGYVPGQVSSTSALILLAASAAFLCVNAVAVATAIAIDGDVPWIRTAMRMASTSVLLSAGAASLGLLAVLLVEDALWALPALAMPVVLLRVASRAQVDARLDRERRDALIAVEQSLAAATRVREVDAALVEGAQTVLGLHAAIWRAGTWTTLVPEPAGNCPVEPSLAATLFADGRTLGPAVNGPVAAIGAGEAVIVAWSGEIDVDAEAGEWLERLGRSGRASYERAAVATALDAERATLAAVVHGTADGILVLDHTNRIRLWNPAMAELSGRSAGAAVGEEVDDVLGEGPWSVDGVHDVERDEDQTWRVSSASLVDREQGALRVAVVHDVSAERRLARAKDDMLAVVSHELRTPLTPIKGCAQLLRRRWERIDDAQRESLLGQIEERADHLTHLVGDLLLVGRLSAQGTGRPALHPVPTDLARLVDDCTSSASDTRTTHQLRAEVPETLVAITDPLRMRQVLDNLLDNACKFSPAGSMVTATLTVDGDHAVIAVEDTGRGIPADRIDRIFERFERVEDPLYMTTSGAGLGLYIVRELVTALGGTIEVHSELGLGTTFTVRMPLTAPAELEAPAVANARS